VWPCRNFVMMFDAGKTRMIGLPYGEKIWQYVKPFSSNTGTSRTTDRRTDRRTELLYQYRASVYLRAIKTWFSTNILLSVDDWWSANNNCDRPPCSLPHRPPRISESLFITACSIDDHDEEKTKVWNVMEWLYLGDYKRRTKPRPRPK